MSENITYVEMNEWLEKVSNNYEIYCIKNDYIKEKKNEDGILNIYLKDKDENNNKLYYNADNGESFIYIYYYIDIEHNIYKSFLHANIVITKPTTRVVFYCYLFLKTDKTYDDYKVNTENYINGSYSCNGYYIYSNDFNNITVINKDVNGVSNTEDASSYIIEGNEDYSIKFNTFNIDKTEQSYDPNKSVYTIKGFQCEFKNSVTIPDGKTIENTENSKDVIFDEDLTLGIGSKFIAKHAHVIIKGSLTMGNDAEIKCRKLTF